MEFQAVWDFWFEEIDPEQWRIKDPEFDALMVRRFSELHAAAVQCELYEWRATPQGRLAEVIVLDQFSRNMFRGSPLSFAADPLALALAQEVVATGLDQVLTTRQRGFLYMPYMHSESLLIHEEAVRLFEANGVEETVDYEMRHKRIIERFGRYPHRNAILGRESTDEEIEFLKQPGSSF